MELVLYLDHVSFANMSHIYWLDQWRFIMRRMHFLDCVEFYLGPVLTKLLIVGVVCY